MRLIFNNFLLFLAVSLFQQAHSGTDKFSSLALLQAIEDLSGAKVHSAQLLSKFDADLNYALAGNRSGFLHQSTTYKKLLVMKSLEEDLSHRIISLSNLNSKSALKVWKNAKHSKSVFFDLSDLSHEEAIQLSPQLFPAILESSLDDSRKSELERRFLKKYKTEIQNGLDIRNENNKIFVPIAEKEKIQPGTGSKGNITGSLHPKNSFTLTFDDGPRNATSPLIMENMKKSGVTAEFFWLAQLVLQNQPLVDLANKHKFPLANHSYSHRSDFGPRLGDTDLEHEITASTEVEKKAFGYAPKFFRCPYGSGTGNERVRSLIAKNNLIHVFWNIDSLDWKDKDPDSILERVKKQMALEGRGVILMHDIHKQTVIASKKLIEYTDSLKGTANEVRWVDLATFVEEYNRN